MSPAQVERYLSVLGVERHPEGLVGLRDLVTRHLCRVPFENVSKLIWPERCGQRGRPDLNAFLDGIEGRDLGGTCYANNPFLHMLLDALGYDAQLLGADMGEMRNVHTCIRVRCERISFHVDAGYAAPLVEPIRLDRLPHVVTGDGCTYRLETADEPGRFDLSQVRDGATVHGYKTRPETRGLDFFAPAIRASFESSAEFMRRLRIVRVFEDGSAEIHNETLRVHRRGLHTATALGDLAELERAVAQDLGLPRLPVRAAVEVLEGRTGRSLFG